MAFLRSFPKNSHKMAEVKSDFPIFSIHRSSEMQGRLNISKMWKNSKIAASYFAYQQEFDISRETVPLIKYTFPGAVMSIDKLHVSLPVVVSEVPWVPFSIHYNSWVAFDYSLGFMQAIEKQEIIKDAVLTGTLIVRVATKISRNEISRNFAKCLFRNFAKFLKSFRETNFATKFRGIRKIFSKISAQSFREISIWQSFWKFFSRN